MAIKRNPRSNKKGKKKNKKTGAISVARLFPPDKKFVKLVYNALDVSSSSSAGGLSGAYTFRLNSLYDPDYTGTGGQPRYFDTLVGADNTAAPYQKYTVYACKYYVTPVPTVSPTPIHCAVCIHPSGVGTLSTMAEAVERQWCKHFVIGTSTSSRPITVSGMVPMSKIMGCNQSEIMNDDTIYAGSYNSNPQRPCYFDLFTQATGGNNTTVLFTVKLEFYAVLKTKNDVADS